jgi:hypothetical protein
MAKALMKTIRLGGRQPRGGHGGIFLPGESEISTDWLAESAAGERGTPQGAVISPILANVYLHYVYDLWTHRWRRKATGDVIVIRYADDTIVGF